MKRFFALVLLVALYSATSVYASSSPGFQITGPATATPINDHDTIVKIPITVTPVDGFTGGILLQCAQGSLPPGAVSGPICGFPIIFPTVTISGTQPAHTSLAVATDGVALPAVSTTTAELHSGGLPYSAMILFPVALLLIGLNPTSYHKMRVVLSCAILSGLFLATSCGSSEPRTTHGTYTILMHGMDTATGMITATGSVTVVVQ